MADALSLFAFGIQYVYDVAALFLAGLALNFVLGVARGRHAAAFVVLAFLVAALLAARLLLANAKLGGNAGAAFAPETFPWVWSAYGRQVLAILAGGAFAVLGALLRSRLILLAAALSVSAGFALGGHTQSLERPGAYPWLTGLHVLIASFWFAAPAVLWPRASLPRVELVRRLKAFSNVARLAVPAVFVAGIFLAWRIAGGWEGLSASAYGLIIVGKLFVASVALGLGALNKIWVTKRVEENELAGRSALAITLGLDAALFLAAVGLVAFATTIGGPSES